MTIEHHPTDSMLAEFAAGTLDHGQHVAIATHLVSCPECRAFTRAVEQTGGTMLTRLPPASMSSSALQQAESRLTNPARRDDATPAATDVEIHGMPEFVRRYQFGRWTWVAPSVHMRPIMLPHSSETRVFLLRSGPGTKMLQHTHTGIEMTCVLSGAFTHEGGRYGPGDFDLGDESVDHQPIVETGQDCVCLVAMQGQLRLDGLIGRIIQPFLRL